MSKDYGCAACLSSSANNYPHTYDNDCLGRLPDNQGITPKHLRNLRNVTGQPACGCSNCNATTGVTDLELNGIKVGTVVRSNPLHQFHKPSNLGYCPKRNPPLSAPTNTDEADNALKLLILIANKDYISKEVFEEFQAALARLIALKQREAQLTILRGFRRRDFVRDDFYEHAIISKIAQLNTIIEGENHGA